MTFDVMTAVRLPCELVERLDRAVERMKVDPAAAMLRPTRSSLLRLAVVRGLEVLEKEVSTS